MAKTLKSFNTWIAYRTIQQIIFPTWFNIWRTVLHTYPSKQQINCNSNSMIKATATKFKRDQRLCSSPLSWGHSHLMRFLPLLWHIIYDNFYCNAHREREREREYKANILQRQSWPLPLSSPPLPLPPPLWLLLGHCRCHPQVCVCIYNWPSLKILNPFSLTILTMAKIIQKKEV